jgi:UDP-N-acetylglucosamine:LPS N-acetylglucosamine transferase
MKIIAVASAGGHWIQLLRLKPAFEGNEVVFVSTKASFAAMVEEHKYYQIDEFSRWNSKFKMIKLFWQSVKIIRNERPSLVLSTGAGPGVIFLFAANLLGVRTIWIDSIANVEKVSYSALIAVKFATKVYTQWPNLAKGKIVYAGNVLV